MLDLFFVVDGCTGLSIHVTLHTKLLRDMAVQGCFLVSLLAVAHNWMPKGLPDSLHCIHKLTLTEGVRNSIPAGAMILRTPLSSLGVWADIERLGLQHNATEQSVPSHDT